MPHLDLPLEQLTGYLPPRTAPDDFDDFWSRTLQEVARHPLAVQRSAVDLPLTTVEVSDVRFAGWGGAPVAAWLVLPAHRPERPLPCVVEFVGYTGGRGLPHERLVWASAGYAHLVMDTRGQGSGSFVGATADPDDAGAPSVAGFLTRGVQSPDTHYYRRLFADAVRAVEVAAGLPEVDPERVVVAGASQGGGMALAVASLSPRVRAALVDVPFLCAFRRATELTDEEPYAEIARYLAAHRDRVEEVFATLAYVDGVNHAARASAPALFSVGLVDQVCPPSTVFAAYNHYGARAADAGRAVDKDIRVWHYSGHEGGGAHQVREQLAWLARRLGPLHPA